MASSHQLNPLTMITIQLVFPRLHNPGTPDNSFFKGRRRKYEWNFVRPPNPNVQITNEMSLSQTHVTGGKEYKWDSSLPPDELDSFTLTPSTEDSKECSKVVGGKGYSWDFYLAPGAEVHSSSCPSKAFIVNSVHMFVHKIGKNMFHVFTKYCSCSICIFIEDMFHRKTIQSFIMTLRINHEVLNPHSQ